MCLTFWKLPFGKVARPHSENVTPGIWEAPSTSRLPLAFRAECGTWQDGLLTGPTLGSGVLHSHCPGSLKGHPTKDSVWGLGPWRGGGVQSAAGADRGAESPPGSSQCPSAPPLLGPSSTQHHFPAPFQGPVTLTVLY